MRYKSATRSEQYVERVIYIKGLRRANVRVAANMFSTASWILFMLRFSTASWNFPWDFPMGFFSGYYSDQTQGLGPEVVSLAAAARPGRYRVGAKYFSSGAMGAARGTVLVRQMVAGKVLGEARKDRMDVGWFQWV